MSHIIEFQQQMMEMLDGILQSNRMNEGEYLKACNHLKNEEWDEFENMFAPPPDQVEHDDNWDMVYYYGASDNEPQLVEIYC